MIAERGVSVDHATVNRSSIKILLVLPTMFRRRKRPVDMSWRMPLHAIDKPYLNPLREDNAPVNMAESCYPYLVVHLMPAMYQREEITVRSGEPKAHVGHRNCYVHHVSPFANDGSISQGCREILVAAVLDAVLRTRFPMCLVWAANSCTFLERDGSVREGSEPPSGGLGTGGVGGMPMPADIAFDDPRSVKGWRPEDR